MATEDLGMYVQPRRSAFAMGFFATLGVLAALMLVGIVITVGIVLGHDISASR